ncbi:hypothetical protein WILDE_13 [Arthrobacter phage Wilde]|uniref:Ribbon-helix-helix DNA binding domain protein n=1 Tax=Arthrobacter phage Wilde TaxID=1772323 RepID=A0A0U4B7U0_9CAUD|nr:hypothetical protein WILDE_13 [Arthrobacter phage Wilde]
MANPNGNLAGATDPSIPGWQDRINERVREQQKNTQRKRERTRGMSIPYDPELHKLLIIAAQRRDISLVGYCRRAIMAMIAHDLDLPFKDVAQHGAQPVPFGKSGAHFKERTNDNGMSFGRWSITGLK